MMQPLKSVSTEVVFDFTFFISSHGVCRLAISEMENHLLSRNPDRHTLFPTLWRRYQKIHQIHSEMEDYGLFPFLDSLSDHGVMTEAGCWSAHSADADAAMRVDHAIGRFETDKMWARILEVFCEWKSQHVAHMAREEELWLQSIANITAKFTPLHVVQALHQRVLSPAFERQPEAFAEYIGWCVRFLSNYGKTMDGLVSATKAFLLSLRELVNSHQWSVLLKTIRVLCKPMVWQRINESDDLEKPSGTATVLEEPSPLLQPMPLSVTGLSTKGAMGQSESTADVNQLEAIPITLKTPRVKPISPELSPNYNSRVIPGPVTGSSSEKVGGNVEISSITEGLVATTYGSSFLQPLSTSLGDRLQQDSNSQFYSSFASTLSIHTVKQISRTEEGNVAEIGEVKEKDGTVLETFRKSSFQLNLPPWMVRFSTFLGFHGGSNEGAKNNAVVHSERTLLNSSGTANNATQKEPATSISHHGITTSRTATSMDTQTASTHTTNSSSSFPSPPNVHEIVTLNHHTCA